MPGKSTILCRGGRIGKVKAERENSVTSQIKKHPLAGYKGGRIKRKLNWSKSTTLKGEKSEQNE